MTCREYKDVMMAYLDGELENEQIKTFQAHLKDCPECRQDLEQFTSLKEITDSVSLVEPEDRVWDQYWDNVYNRLERRMGWVFFSIAGIVLGLFGGFKVVEAVVLDPGVSLMFKVFLVVLILGLSILFTSVLRERLYFWQRDRYKDVRR
jgi:predicted anti-sigma-YlaC factor YlaD